MSGILYNRCHGGFGFSEECKEEYLKRTGRKLDEYNVNRSDPELIKLYEEFGSDWMSGLCAKITLKKVSPTLIKYLRIGEYDGKEWIDSQMTKLKCYEEFMDIVKKDPMQLEVAYLNLCGTLKEIEDMDSHIKRI